MFWKDELASELLSKSHWTYAELKRLQDRFHTIRIKTLGPSGSTSVINLNDKNQWIKPREWADNHVQSLRATLLETESRLISIGSDPGCRREDTCTLLREVQEQRSNDLATLDQLRADARLKEEELRQANEQIGRLRRQRDAAVQSYFDAFKVAEESSLGLKTAKEDFVRLKDAVESKSFFRL